MNVTEDSDKRGFMLDSQCLLVYTIAISLKLHVSSFRTTGQVHVPSFREARHFWDC